MIYTSDHITKYRKQKLSKADKEAFEHAMAHDPDFATEVNDAIKLNELLIDVKLEELREIIKQELKEERESKDLKLFGKYLLLVIAGCGTLYLLFTIFKKNQDISHNKQYDEVLINQTTSTEAIIQPENTPAHKATKKEVKDLSNYDSKEKLTKVNFEEKNLNHTKEVQPGNQEGSQVTIKDEKLFKNEAPQNPSAISDPCQSITIKANTDIKSSCTEESNGSIKITTISGGKLPYIYSLDGNTSNSGIWTELSPGIYRMVIKDGNGCISSHDIMIGTKHCTIKKEFSFAPDLGEIWTMPLIESCIVTIIDRSGKKVFEKLAEENIEWRGENDAGGLLPQGIYLYSIQYTSGKNETGYITIIR
ncbi:MAG: gliding motility-associated C-terminal domain-containing protein [Cytophagaceae bacterium]